VYEKSIEYIATCSNRGGSAQSPQEAVVWKLFDKAECADLNLAPDIF
jgi:hypothetical protein